MSDCCSTNKDSCELTGSEPDQSNKPDNRQDRSRLHIAIVGTGSGAFAAAIKAVELGARVSIIEGADIIGGTCVNVGCVPSKIMIQGGKIAWQSQHHNYEGIQCQGAVINRAAMVAQQQQWVQQLRQDKYESILESNPDINLIRGRARFSDKDTLIINRADGSEETLQADRYLLAVGARPAIPAIDGLKETPYWTSTEALVAEEIPEHLVVLGGSVVALELAQAFLHLGAKVTLMARSTLLSKEDDELGAGLKPLLEEEGMDVRLHTLPSRIQHNDGQFTVSTEQDEIHCDRLLVATGRQSNADRLALENVGVKTTKSGNIIIDGQMRTNVENIYAAGDCTNLPQYVYVAAAAGSRAVRNMLGENTLLDLATMPAVVFTSPQVASVGLSKLQAATRGLAVESRTLPLENVPRAIANMDTRGFIKLVAEKDSGRILGCQILAESAGEIIQSAALAIHNRMTVEQLADQLFPYLTMVEGLKLTAQTFNKDIKQLSCCAA